MNKLFTKIASLSIGLAMAIGVGVAVGSKDVKAAKAADANTKYELINSTSSLESGKSYIITNGTSGTVKAIATTSNSNNRKTTDVTVSNNQITRGSSIMSFTLGGSTDAWTFATENYAGTAGYLASAESGKNNYLRVIATAGTATISFSGDAAVINIGPHSSRTLIRYNPNNGSPMFACYASGQNAIYLWKESSSACEHVWDSGEVSTPATCTETGVMTYTCTLCGETKEETIPATGHLWGSGVVHAATCTEGGYTEYECSVCHEIKHEDETDPLGHNYVDGVCTRCGAEEPDEETTSMSTFTSVSGYVGDDSNISYAATQGTSQTAPAINNDEIRIYQGGGLLTITANNDSKIKSITIGSSMVTSVSITADGVDKGEHDIAAGDTITVNNISSDVVVFECTGADKNHRLYLNYLSVTYEGTQVTKYTITYNANNGTGTMSPTTGESPSVQECAFTREGYDFARWNTQADGEGVDYAVGATVEEDLTLYAIWEEQIEPIGADVTMDGISSASSATVNGHPAVKCGTSNNAGSMKLTLKKANITKIKVYIAGWNNDTNKTVNVEIDNGATITEESVTLIQDSGISGSSLDFTLDGAETLYKHEFTISPNAPADTIITLTAAYASKDRFVVWGATNLFAETFADEFLTNLTCNNAGTSAPTYAEGYDWSKFESIYNGLDSEEQGRLHDAIASQSGTQIQQAMARYDYIEGKYNPEGTSTSYKNFIGRTITPNQSGRVLLSVINKNTSTVIIIVVISSISVAAIGGYFLFRKKKED